MNPFWTKLFQSLTPRQACWLCIAVTVTGGGYGLQTFARDSEVKEIRIELLQSRLLDLRLRQCDAIKRSQTAAFFAARLQEEWDKYIAVARRSPQLPSCIEL